MNAFQKENEEIEIPILEIGEEAEKNQITALKQLRVARDQKAVNDALQKVQIAAAGNDNIFPPILEAAKAYATLGEIVDAMKKEFGEWQESAVF